MPYPSFGRDAACRDITDPDLFFPDRDRRKADQARQICSGCPVQAACLEYAIANKEPYGVWGSFDEKDRRQLPVALAKAAAASTSRSTPSAA